LDWKLSVSYDRSYLVLVDLNDGGELKLGWLYGWEYKKLKKEEQKRPKIGPQKTGLGTAR